MDKKGLLSFGEWVCKQVAQGTGPKPPPYLVPGKIFEDVANLYCFGRFDSAVAESSFHVSMLDLYSTLNTCVTEADFVSTLEDYLERAAGSYFSDRWNEAEVIRVNTKACVSLRTRFPADSSSSVISDKLCNVLPQITPRDVSEFLAAREWSFIYVYADFCSTGVRMLENITSTFEILKSDPSLDGDMAALNGPDNPGWTQKYGIRLYPTLLLFQREQEISSVTGYVSQSEILEILKSTQAAYSTTEAKNDLFAGPATPEILTSCQASSASNTPTASPTGTTQRASIVGGNGSTKASSGSSQSLSHKALSSTLSFASTQEDPQNVEPVNEQDVKLATGEDTISKLSVNPLAFSRVGSYVCKPFLHAKGKESAGTIADRRMTHPLQARAFAGSEIFTIQTEAPSVGSERPTRTESFHSQISVLTTPVSPTSYNQSRHGSFCSKTSNNIAPVSPTSYNQSRHGSFCSKTSNNIAPVSPTSGNSTATVKYGSFEPDTAPTNDTSWKGMQSPEAADSTAASSSSGSSMNKKWAVKRFPESQESPDNMRQVRLQSTELKKGLISDSMRPPPGFISRQSASFNESMEKIAYMESIDTLSEMGPSDMEVGFGELVGPVRESGDRKGSTIGEESNPQRDMVCSVFGPVTVSRHNSGVARTYESRSNVRSPAPEISNSKEVVPGSLCHVTSANYDAVLHSPKLLLYFYCNACHDPARETFIRATPYIPKDVTKGMLLGSEFSHLVKKHGVQIYPALKYFEDGIEIGTFHELDEKVSAVKILRFLENPRKGTGEVTFSPFCASGNLGRENSMFKLLSFSDESIVNPNTTNQVRRIMSWRLTLEEQGIDMFEDMERARMKKSRQMMIQAMKLTDVMSESVQLRQPNLFDPPRIIFLGGGAAAGKSTAVGLLKKSHFWETCGDGVVVIEADTFKMSDPLFSTISKLKGDAAYASHVVHSNSLKDSETLLLAALTASRDIIMDGTASWAPYVQQTINMVRNCHKYRYIRGPGYKEAEDGTVTEQYWIQQGEREVVTLPYKIDLVGITNDPHVAIRREIGRQIITGRGVKTGTILRSHKLFSASFPKYIDWFDALILLDNNAKEPRPIAVKGQHIACAEGEDMPGESATFQVLEEALYEQFQYKAHINTHANSVIELYDEMLAKQETVLLQ